MSDDRAFYAGPAWLGFALVVMWFNPHHGMLIVAMVSSSVWFAANWLAQQRPSPDTHPKDGDVQQAPLVSGGK